MSKKCFEGDCCDPSCWNEIVIFHSITETKFNLMISGYSNQGKTIPAPEIAAMVNGPGVSCEDSCLAASADFDLHHTNSDITVNMDPRNSAGDKFRYSIPFMKGLLQLAPVEISFYKASRINDGSPDVIIAAAFIDGSSQYFDLSDVHP